MAATNEQGDPRTVSPREAYTWLHDNGATPDYPGLASYAPEQLSNIIFAAIKDGATKTLVLDTWALTAFVKIRASGETAFDRHVVFPARECGIDVARLVAAIERQARASPLAFAVPQTATALLALELPPLRLFVQDLLAEGLTLLAGKPKKGKSYLALDMCLSLAVGRAAFWHFPTETSSVLYVSLEDGPRRLQRRLHAIQPNLATPEGLAFLYAFPRLGDGALEALGYYAQQYQVIVIDVLGRILPPQTAARKSLSEYQELTDVLGPIQQLALEKRMAIILIDHVRKASSDDIGDTIMGTQGKFGVADHALIWERKGHEKDGALTMLSRDLEEEKYILSMINGHLEFLGKGEIYELESEQNRIIKAMEEEGKPMNVVEVMKAMGVDASQYPRFRKMLYRLYEEDRIGRTKRGLYRVYSAIAEAGEPF